MFPYFSLFYDRFSFHEPGQTFMDNSLASRGSVSPAIPCIAWQGLEIQPLARDKLRESSRQPIIIVLVEEDLYLEFYPKPPFPS